MTTSYGLTADGFVTKPLLDIKADLEAGYKSVYGENVKLDPKSVNGQRIGRFAAALSELWDALEALDAAFDPDRTSGQAQSSLCALTGTTRNQATHSTVNANLTGTDGTVIAAAKQASVTGTGVKFESTEEITLHDAGDLTGSVTLTDGSQTVSGSGTAFLTELFVGQSIKKKTDGVSSWAKVAVVSADDAATLETAYEGTGGAGTATCANRVEFQALETGPLVAATGTLTVIETPVSGWETITNDADAVLGEDVESDANLRLRREVELRNPANAALDAIRTKLLALDEVDGAVVFENCSMITDGDGIPPKSVRAVVHGGTAQDIRDELLARVAAGIGTDGTTSGTAVDSEGISHTIAYSEATEKDIWIILNITKDPDDYPVDGDTQVEDAVLAYGETLLMAKNVVAARIAAEVFPSSDGLRGVAGVLECEVLIGLSNPPTTSTTIPIDIDELAVFDSARITVNSIDGEP